MDELKPEWTMGGKNRCTSDEGRDFRDEELDDNEYSLLSFNEKSSDLQS